MTCLVVVPLEQLEECVVEDALDAQAQEARGVGGRGRLGRRELLLRRGVPLQPPAGQLQAVILGGRDGQMGFMMILALLKDPKPQAT